MMEHGLIIIYFINFRLDIGPDELVPKCTQDWNSLGEIAKIMMEHGLIIIYIIYFRSDLTNSLYDGIENILFIYYN